MKILLLLLTCLINHNIFCQSLNDCGSFLNNTYNQKLIKKNRIKEIEIENYYEADYLTKYKLYFNNDGRLLKLLILDKFSKIKRKGLYYINKQKNSISIYRYNTEFNKTDTITYVRKYFKGKIVKDSISYSKDFTQAFNYKYDYKNNLIKNTINSYYKLNHNITKKVFTYENNNIGKPQRVIEMFYESVNDSIGVLLSKRNITFNKIGKIKSEIEELNSHNYSPQNNGNSLYFYDKFKNLIEIKRPKGTSYKYKYSDAGLLEFESSQFSIDDKEIKMSNRFIYQFR